MKNYSPWLYQLDQARSSHKLERVIAPHAAIVGAGIAGIATAFFALKYTDQTVVVLERHKLAHGATGHNAGQVVSYFERGFASLVEEFGLDMAAQGQQAVEDAWSLLDEMYTDAGLDIPFARFVGHTGLSSFSQVLVNLENNRARREAGLRLEDIIISRDALFLRELPLKYAGLYRLSAPQEILERLESINPDYIACVSYQKGCVNSALFCQEVARYLLGAYPGRFALYEHTAVHKIILHESVAVLDLGEHAIKARRVVLCTNGFEDFSIINENGLGVDGRFHASLQGRVAYMSGYLEVLNKPPMAVSYFPEPGASKDENYFYLTRRPYEYEHRPGHNLVLLGGPDELLPEQARYSHDREFPERHVAVFDAFLRRTYELDPNKKIEYLFTWHGLMGYTKNGVRMVGPEPQNPILLYNLGCNGVGILPSVMGGRVVARHIADEQVAKSIFDVPTAR
ncbi:MAG: FAD-binding oxidoreductase [Candidatus Pacebacteria bacterium]|nr:FAD-binding oxidoreductase [Candidatus Paceibacterota bacterium]